MAHSGSVLSGVCLPCDCFAHHVLLLVQDKKYGFGGAERKRAKLNDKK
jgi:hypothetical protein